MNKQAIDAALAKANRTNKLASFFVLGLFIAALVGVNHLLAAYGAKIYWGGKTVWVVAGVMVAIALFQAMVLPYLLIADKKKYIPAEKVDRLPGPHSIQSVRQWVDEIAKEFGLADKYRLIIVNDLTQNAFATGGIFGTRIIALHTGLIANMNEEEIKGVVAHEFTHSKNADLFLLIFLSSLVSALAIIGRLVLYTGDSGNSKKRNSGGYLLLAGLALIVLGSIFAPLMRLFVSRRRELMADAGAVAAGYGDGLSRALLKLDKAPKTKIADPIKAALYISVADTAFSTHPPISARVEKIGEMMQSKPESAFLRWSGIIWRWFALPLVAGLLWVAPHHYHAAGVLGIPFVFIAGTVLLNFLMSMLGVSYIQQTEGTKKSVEGILGTGLAVLLLTAMYYGLGVYFLTNVDSLVTLPFAGALFVLWMIKPVISLFGAMGSGVFSGISDLCNFAFIGYIVLALLLMLL